MVGGNKDIQFLIGKIWAALNFSEIRSTKQLAKEEQHALEIKVSISVIGKNLFQ